MSRELATRVLEIVDAGLVAGLGSPVPGQMCVEAAVCYALGLPHGAEPTCVAPVLCAFKIMLNDAHWSSPAARARGLRRLAIIQLGTVDTLNKVDFIYRIRVMAVSKILSRILRATAAKSRYSKASRIALEKEADLCEKVSTLTEAKEAAYAASFTISSAGSLRLASYAGLLAGYEYSTRIVPYLADDATLAFLAEEAVQILVDMGVPGAAWLDLAPLPEAPQ